MEMNLPMTFEFGNYQKLLIGNTNKILFFVLGPRFIWVCVLCSWTSPPLPSNLFSPPLPTRVFLYFFPENPRERNKENLKKNLFDEEEQITSEIQSLKKRCSMGLHVNYTSSCTVNSLMSKHMMLNPDRPSFHVSFTWPYTLSKSPSINQFW